MMQNWFSENAQSNVVEQAAHDAIQRGPVAKAKRAFLRWWNRDAIARKEVLSLIEEVLLRMYRNYSNNIVTF